MFKFLKLQKNRGMTYVELIVVISIVALLSTVSLFNYADFQEKVNMKNLANDIASRIVEAQKNAIGGRVPATGAPAGWRPSYGVYFDISEDASFVNFLDLTQDKKYTCPGSECTGANTIQITKGNYISNIDYVTNGIFYSIDSPLHITFTRPDSGATFYIGSNVTPLTNAQFVQVTLSSKTDNTFSIIKIFPSGRVQIN